MSDLREALQNASGFLDTPVARRKFGNDPFYADVVASIRAALSAQPQPEAVEAVAWQFQSVDGGWITFIGKFDPDYFIKAGLRIRPLFTAPPLAPDERMRKALRNIAEGNLGDAPGQANYARVKQVAHEALSRAREGLPPLSCDFAQSLPGGKLDDSTYGKIEDALDKIEAPAQDANGKWLSLHERIATICSPTEARMRAALERIAGSHWERAGYCQSDVEDVPDLTAEEAMREAREALSGAADAANASAEARSFSYALERVKSGIPMHRLAWKLNKFIRVSKPLDASLDYLELAYTDGRCAPWTPTRCDLLENDWREFDAAPSRADEGKESEGGGQDAPAKCSVTGARPPDTSCAAEPEVAPGPSDPSPPDATAQREAVARAKLVAQRYIDSVSDDLPPEVTPPTSDEVGEALCILALSTRAGG